VLLDKPMANWRMKLNKIRPTHHSKTASTVLLTTFAGFKRLFKKLDQDILYEKGIDSPSPLPLYLSFVFTKEIVEMHQACNMVTLLLHLSKACKMLGWGWGWRWGGV